jgi:hypothetical protein
MKTLLKAIATCSRLAVGLALVMGMTGSPAWGVVGSGSLTVDHNTTLCPGAFGFDDFDSPNHWDVNQADLIHINISPGFSTCTTGNIGARCSSNTECNQTGNCTGQPGNKHCGNTGASCTSDTDCNVAGTCASALECSGDTTVFIKGKTGNACTPNGGTCTSTLGACDSNADCPNSDCSQCNGTNETGCDSDGGLCKFIDQVGTSGRTGSGAIDVCYTVRSNACATAQVAYCTSSTESNVQVSHNNTTIFMAADIRTVASGTDTDGDNDNDVPLNTSAQCSPQELKDCTNVVGSKCCGLTQGAYGSPNSVATATGGACGSPNCSATGLGFLPAAACQGCDAFAGDANAATIGNLGATSPANSVRILDLCTLITWLPASGAARGPLNGDNDYGTIPATDLTGSGSKGSGGGVLSGQTMAAGLNTFLSNCSPPFGGGSFSTAGFGGFVLPAADTLVCTTRAGEDKVLGTGDDISQAFSYPACVAGKTVADVITCANDQLNSGTNTCNCSAADLNNALSNINVEFDQCGVVIACPPTQTTAGIFATNAPAPTSGRCGSAAGDAAAVAMVRSGADSVCVGSNHGTYVSCVTKQARQAATGGALRQVCKAKVTTCAALSTVGTDRVTCCRTDSRGVTRCSVKSNAALCVPPLNGSACVGSKASCCDACSSGGCN